MLVTILGVLLLAGNVSDSVKRDLNSPLYAVRENARDVLRASFVPTDRRKWDVLVADLERNKGASPSEVEAICFRVGVVYPERVEKLPPDCTVHTRLDSCWMLECVVRDDRLIESRLFIRPPLIPTEPPAGYTGLWRTYRENGDRASETYYSKGNAMGPLADTPKYPSATPFPLLPPKAETTIEYDPAK